MSYDEIVNEVKKIVCNNLCTDEEDLKVETHLFNDLSADELDMVEIILDCEEFFGIGIEEEDCEHIKTVGDLAKAVVNVLGIKPE